MSDKCISVPLSDDDMSAAIDSTSSLAVNEHLAQCAFCRDRFEHAVRLEAKLYVELDRFACPEPLVLCDYRLGLLSTPEEHEVRMHIATCPLCIEELDTFTAFDVMGADGSTKREQTTQERFKPGLRDRIARLVTPDASRSLAFGVRGSDGDQVSLYEAPGLKVILARPPITEQMPIPIEGQIYLSSSIHTDLTGALVQIFQGQTLVSSTTVDEFSSFSSSIPHAGTYMLSIYLDNERVLLEITIE